MKATVAALISAAVIAPASAQAATARLEQTQPGQARVQAKEEKAKPEVKATAKERAKLAKAKKQAKKKAPKAS
ncbi:MAG: hypothetical protein H7Y14_12495 [Burkholderiales bacterium]|nr:hypothetical protein [Burkholderiales bacterium]